MNRRAVDRWAAPDDPSNWFTGLGHYTRANTEPCLIFKRGKPLPRLSKGVKQFVAAPIGPHSAKPEVVQDRIEQLYAGPYFEMFARRKRAGWACWGNQIKPDIRLGDLGPDMYR